MARSFIELMVETLVLFFEAPSGSSIMATRTSFWVSDSDSTKPSQPFGRSSSGGFQAGASHERLSSASSTDIISVVLLRFSWAASIASLFSLTFLLALGAAALDEKCSSTMPGRPS